MIAWIALFPYAIQLPLFFFLFLCVFDVCLKKVLASWQREKEKGEDWSQRVARVILHIYVDVHINVAPFVFYKKKDLKVCIYHMYVYCTKDIYLYT